MPFSSEARIHTRGGKMMGSRAPLLRTSPRGDVLRAPRGPTRSSREELDAATCAPPYPGPASAPQKDDADEEINVFEADQKPMMMDAALVTRMHSSPPVSHHLSTNVWESVSSWESSSDGASPPADVATKLMQRLEPLHKRCSMLPSQRPTG